MINLLGNELKPLKFQKKIIKHIANKDALVIMPTGSGKTLVAYSWANVVNPDYGKIIFTAPTKAVSVERYQELKKQGLDVGIITGDVKMHDDYNILCMTQEIYNNCYTNIVATVIIDEFHYIFRNDERARCYIDSLVKTNKKSKLLLMSATINEPHKLTEWLNILTGRKFTVGTTSQRLVPLEYDYKGIKYKNIKDAIIFCFSRRDIHKIKQELFKHRSKNHGPYLVKHDKDYILQLCNNYSIEYDNIWDYGIAEYYGMLLPKEKMIVEHLFRKGYVDVIIGTDALALGVNTPAKYAILATTKKYDRHIMQASEFNQLVGRAGRYGYHDIGIATYLLDSPINQIQSSNGATKIDNSIIANDFKFLSNKSIEKTKIKVGIDYKLLFSGKYIEEEIDNILKLSYNLSETDNENIIKNSYENFNQIQDMLNVIKYNVSNEIYQMLIDMLIRYYLPEIDVKLNIDRTLSATIDFCNNNYIDTEELLKPILQSNGEEYMLSPGEALHEMLLLYKWLRHIQSDGKYEVYGLDILMKTINDLDETVFNPDLRLD